MTSLTITETYRECIKEAYINPIRTATIIDDEYPTLSTMIKYYKNDKLGGWKSENIERLEAFLALCADEAHAWAADVYNGSNPNIKDVAHLNNSDLIVLDYHLDPGNDESGEKALQCVNMLADNNHFNLVVIHTKGVQDDISKVFQELLVSLIPCPQVVPSPEGIVGNVENFIDDVEIDSPGVLENAKELIGLLEAIEIYKEPHPDFKKLFNNPNGLFAPVQEDIRSLLKENEDEITGQDVIRRLINEKITAHESDFSLEGKDVTSWEYNETYNWIATGKVFITVIKKSKEVNDILELPSKLTTALEKYFPSPMLLVMAKMRYELEENGFHEATKISKQRLIQAAWLHQLLSAPKESRHVACDKILENHWDRISSETKPNLTRFTEKLASCYQDEPRETIKILFGSAIIGQLTESIAALNCYSCSKDVVGNHLTTGHIIELRRKGDSEYWICLSPACDLVPEQKTSDWHFRVGVENLPFKAVKLEAVDELKTANKSANRNSHIYIKIEDKVVAFRIPDGKPDNPVWEQMFAGNSGRFQGDNQLTIQRIELHDPKIQIKSKSKRIRKKHTGNKHLAFKEYPNSRVVSELRYEYALNLLQRFGGNLTRVGLGFVKDLW